MYFPYVRTAHLAVYISNRNLFYLAVPCPCPALPGSILGGRGLMHFEQTRVKDDAGGAGAAGAGGNTVDLHRGKKVPRVACMQTWRLISSLCKKLELGFSGGDERGLGG